MLLYDFHFPPSKTVTNWKVKHLQVNYLTLYIFIHSNKGIMSWPQTTKTLYGFKKKMAKTSDNNKQMKEERRTVTFSSASDVSFQLSSLDELIAVTCLPARFVIGLYVIQVGDRINTSAKSNNPQIVLQKNTNRRYEP